MPYTDEQIAAALNEYVDPLFEHKLDRIKEALRGLPHMALVLVMLKCHNRLRAAVSAGDEGAVLALAAYERLQDPTFVETWRPAETTGTDPTTN